MNNLDVKGDLEYLFEKYLDNRNSNLESRLRSYKNLITFLESDMIYLTHEKIEEETKNRQLSDLDKKEIKKEDLYCYYSDLPSPLAYGQDNEDVNDSDKSIPKIAANKNAKRSHR